MNARHPSASLACLVLAAASLGAGCGGPVMPPPPVTAPAPGVAPPVDSAAEAQRRRRADFRGQPASDDVRRLAAGVLAAGDHGARPFLIIDKPQARAYVFAADGGLLDAAPVLLGLAPGDETVPGIGDRPLSRIRPHERTTAAGRFAVELGRNLREDVLWIDYESGLSLHRVLTHRARDRRIERLATPTPHDNRISYGCINVPVAFFEHTVHPAFRAAGGTAYVLPDTRTLEEVFGALVASVPGSAAGGR